MSENFLADYNKTSEKMDGVISSSTAPKYWISFGNFVINKTMSGNYKNGIPQGRLAGVVGPSGAGKSFIIGNLIKSAQTDYDCGILVIDSENALDNEFLSKIGVKTDDPYYVYRGTGTIDNSTKLIRNFIKSYRAHNLDKKFLIVIDSLDMLETESGLKSYEENGEIKADMGLHPKQIKSMLSKFMHSIADLNISIVCTKQVYKTQDRIASMNPATEWVMTESAMYPFSQVAQVTRLLLKNDITKAYDGIRLKVFGKKTRFTKPYQWVVVEVPYDTGMDPYAGLLDAAVSSGIVERNGAWYNFDDNKFQSKNFDQYREQILQKMIDDEQLVLTVDVDEYDDEHTSDTGTKISVKERRAKKALAEKNENS